MQTNGTYRSVSPVAIAMAYLIGFASAVVPAIVSVYNPHQYEADPILEPTAVRNVMVAVAIAVPLAWLFARRWPKKLVGKLAGTGVVLTLLSIALLGFASSRPMGESGIYLSIATIAATIAIPCTALLTNLFLSKEEG